MLAIWLSIATHGALAKLDGARLQNVQEMVRFHHAPCESPVV